MFYVLHGSDTHSQEEMLQKLKAKLGDPAMLDLNTTKFDKAPSFLALRQACDAMPFLSPKRLVIVRNAFTQKPDKAFVSAVLDYLPTMPDSARLVFMESQALASNSRVVKLADKAENGYVKRFDRPEGAALERWVRKQVNALDGEIEPHAAHILAVNVGNDLQMLSNEIDKLVLYKQGAGVITAGDVNTMCPYVAEANIFDLVDALGNRNGRLATALLHKKMVEGADPFFLFSMFIRQFRLLIQVKELSITGAKPPAIAKALKMHRFVAGKVHKQAQSFELGQLAKIYRHLLDIDVGVKTGQQDMVTALSLLVVRLSHN